MNGRSPYQSQARPLFEAEPKVWISLDEPTQEQVLDCLGRLLLQHVRQTAGGIPQEQTFTKGTQV